MEQTKKKQTEARLLHAARQEFLKKGYAKANLRTICQTAGVTTGAFYFSFPNKEALLSAILDPVIAGYQELTRALALREEEHPDTADENEIAIIRFYADHREEAIILLEKSAGSHYENFRDILEAQMREAFRHYYARCLGAEPDPELIRILAAMRLQGYLEILRGDYSMETRMELARAVGVHADAGTRQLIEYLAAKNAHR